MIKDFKPAWEEEIVDYDLVFFSEPGCGFGFPCDKYGNIDRDTMNPAARRNLEYAESHPEKYSYWFKGVQRRKWKCRHPASGICHCGERIELYNEYLGGCECPKCGQWWNIFGQELNNPETWSKGDDW